VRVLISAAIAALILAAPAQAKLTRADRAQINRTLDTFVATAVRRHDVAKSYDLVTPQERGGMSRRAWAKGDIPVYPYPARGTSWHDWYLDYALKNEIAFELVLQPERGHKADPISFSASMKRIHGRWLVDSFYPAAIFLSSHRVIGPKDFAAPTLVNDAGKSRLGLIALLVFLVVSAVRGRSPRPNAEKRARDADFWQSLHEKNAAG
jgi:hypothetical protein